MTNDCLHRYDSLNKNSKINKNVINYYLTPNTRQLVSLVEQKVLKVSGSEFKKV